MAQFSSSGGVLSSSPGRADKGTRTPGRPHTFAHTTHAMDDAPAPPHVSLEPHFVVDTRHHGKGPIVFSWHPQGTCVATSGSSRVVHIFGTNGE
eukprot:37837-Eustigmatos_ZCMA.PRE.1